jgi:hypothetical protein
MAVAPHHVRRIHRLAYTVLTLIATSCAAAPLVQPATAPVRLQRAVTATTAKRSFRIRGLLASSMPIVEWDTVVVGRDERSLTSTGGLLIETRRIGTATWTRRADQPDTWQQVAGDHPLELLTLLDGRVVALHEQPGALTLTITYDHTDVLDALTRIPSAGAITADVTIIDGLLTNVTLHITGDITARLSFSDYGREITIEPPSVPGS